MPSVAIGLSKNLPNGRVMRTVIGEQDLVVWRSKSGHLSAWDNRCPHRGMRLSHGFVRGEALACVYHGWHYDGKGACRYIPAHPELEPPETIKTTAFGCIDYNGLIWVDLNGDLQLPSFQDGLIPLRSISFNCSSEQIKQAMADFEYLICNGDHSGLDFQKQDLDIWIAGFEKSDIWMHFFFQALPNERSTIHVLCSPNCDIQTQKDMSRFLEQLRTKAEADVEVAA